MRISSNAFQEGERIPRTYTCEGPNISPPLQFSEVPSSARTLALMVEDPDAPARPWVHWLVYNIPADASGFGEGEIAEGGQEGICNGGTYGYEGPCPPTGEHEYHFKLYALDCSLDVPRNADRSAILEAMRGHELAHAVLKGMYRKEKQEATASI